MSGTLRITRFGAADCGGSWLAFASSDEATFFAVVSEIKALGYAHAQWTPDVKAWWLSPSGLARLCAHNHELAWLIGEYLRNDPGEGETSGHAGASDDAYTSGMGGKRRAGGKSGQRRKASGSSGKASGGVPADVAQALATLYLRDDAPHVVVQAAYRALAKASHPDRGGDETVMKRLNLAYERADAWATRLAASA